MRRGRRPAGTRWRVAKKHHERSRFEQENFEFFEQVQAMIEAMKNAWRNKVSRATNKLVVMTTDFNAEIAEDVLLASRAFMRR